jgi:hypothetical protein
MKRNEVRKFIQIPDCESAEEFSVTIVNGGIEFRGVCVSVCVRPTLVTLRAFARMAGVKLPNKNEYMATIRADIMDGNRGSRAVRCFTGYKDRELGYLYYLAFGLEEKGIVL